MYIDAIILLTFVLVTVCMKKKMALMKLEDFLENKIDRYSGLLDSIMPGGSNWEKDPECLPACPYFDRCKGNGPSRKLCSDDWKKAPLNSETVSVMRHIFRNFEIYDKGDYKEGNISILANELCSLFDIELSDYIKLPKSEVMRTVKIRLLQAEFKNFSLIK